MVAKMIRTGMAMVAIMMTMAMIVTQVMTIIVDAILMIMIENMNFLFLKILKVFFKIFVGLHNVLLTI